MSNFKEMIERDLANSNDFGGVCNHIVNGVATPLEYLCFDENSEVIFEKNEYQGVETTVPALTVQTSKADGITHKSIFEIDEKIYGVIEKSIQKDGTTIIFLDKQNG